MVRHYTCPFPFNSIRFVLAKWEKYTKLTEWGYYWEGGFLLVININERPTTVHLRGWRHSAQPWENEARVVVDYDPFLPFLEDDRYDWEPYFMEIPHE